MADTLSRLAGPSQVASGTSTIFTVPSAHIYTVKYITIMNQAGTPTAVEMGINGVANSNLIFPTTQFNPSGGTAYFECTFIFTATDTLQINVSQGSAITVSVHGI